MSQATWPNGSDADFADLARRRDALRQAAAMPGADPLALLDATLAELDGALDAAAKLVTAGAAEPGGNVTSHRSARTRHAAGRVPPCACGVVPAGARRNHTAGERQAGELIAFRPATRPASC